ncbi:MAG: hypothetical protein IPM79_28870 [Polyangiaceae bacterium]|nr:hypothetical protein [Polyangiaceae bacterium]
MSTISKTSAKNVCGRFEIAATISSLAICPSRSTASFTASVPGALGGATGPPGLGAPVGPAAPGAGAGALGFEAAVMSSYAASRVRGEVEMTRLIIASRRDAVASAEKLAAPRLATNPNDTAPVTSSRLVITQAQLGAPSSARWANVSGPSDGPAPLATPAIPSATKAGISPDMAPATELTIVVLSARAPNARPPPRSSSLIKVRMTSRTSRQDPATPGGTWVDGSGSCMG